MFPVTLLLLQIEGYDGKEHLEKIGAFIYHVPKKIAKPPHYYKHMVIRTDDWLKCHIILAA